MFYALNWFVVFSLLVLWSLAAWAFHSIAAWTVSKAGVLAGSSGAIEALRVPEWLAPWISPELAVAFSSAIDALLALAPVLASGLSVVIWVVWGVGSAVLVALGFLLSGLIAIMLRRRASVVASPSRGPVVSG